MKKIYIIGILVVALSLGAIMTTISSSSTYVDFREAAQHPGHVFHVVGKLNKEKPFEYNPHENADLFSFYMKDSTGLEKKVLLNKAKPQDFEKSETIVAIGKIKDDQFIASDILMKCPSKYQETSQPIK